MDTSAAVRGSVPRVSIYSTSPLHNENVKSSTLAKDPRGQIHSAFIHVAVFSFDYYAEWNEKIVQQLLINEVYRMQNSFQSSIYKYQGMTRRDGK